MPCYYPQALLALCNAYDMDENNSQSYREFIEIVYFWMHETYGDCDTVYDERDRFNVSIPSSNHQKKLYDWFKNLGIRIRVLSKVSPIDERIERINSIKDI